MTSDRRFEQELPALLDDLYLGPMPTYRDHVLQQTARTRQRPAWTFVERWLPMVDIARQPIFAPRLPWRTIGAGLVLVALLAALVAALVIAGHPRLPEPFGRARTGLVAFASGGDIYTVDPVTGSSSAIVRGPETDLNPRWSRDGTRLAFERKVDGGAGAGLLFAVRRDGSDLVRVTPDPLQVIDDYAFSPDGKEILISAQVFGAPRVLIAAADGGRIRQLDLGVPAQYAAWRPPDGSEILFMDATDPTVGTIYAIGVDGSNRRTILERTPGRNRGLLDWSPDGSMIAYGEWVDSDCCNTVQTHIRAADGTWDRTLPMPPGALWQTGGLGWSNDGTRLFVNRGYTGGAEESRPVVVPVDGSGAGTEIQFPRVQNAKCCSVIEWAPDDSWILGRPEDPSGASLDQVLLDPVAGTSRSAPWQSVSQPSVQRLAP
jgi:Tol biopolymer transport system component